MKPSTTTNTTTNEEFLELLEDLALEQREQM